MANIKSSKKRIDIAKRNTARNKSRKSEIKTLIKKFDAAVEAKDLDAASDLFKKADKRLKQAEAKNIMHKNKVARTSSRMAKALNSINA
ncbi:30S ribosomal protein S20 [Anaerococcus sp. AGMB09787]|uniref:30S ribosomal protein S20 n=1 Tax=Anaerococcus sp. AGMB09787 TaxID=2922869 RepID=UPI001FAFE5A8|nr:30S ribosomal protein S20 [Anaerococcus sp. AGMB09787]